MSLVSGTLSEMMLLCICFFQMYVNYKRSHLTGRTSLQYSGLIFNIYRDVITK